MVLMFVGTPPAFRHQIKGQKVKTMREILFRGQTRRYGEKLLNVAGDKMSSNWVYGGICKGDGDHSIIYGSNAYPDLRICDKYAVYTDTIGQYTGIIDKNGKKLFEGDIVRFCTEENIEVLSIVHYDLDSLSFIFESEYSTYCFDFDLHHYLDEFEIIGNIYDNPDLIHWDFNHILNIKAERENK